MSDWTDNPFAKPAVASPFADPSVTKATGAPEYNPFDQSAPAPALSFSKPAPPPRPAAAPVAAPVEEPSWAKPKAAPVAPQAVAQPQQPLLPPQQQPPAAVQPATTAANPDDIRRRQEFEAREAEAHKLMVNKQDIHVVEGRPKNWPKFPANWPKPLKPCYHIHFQEISPTYRKSIRHMYYLWYFTCFTLLINFVGNLASLQYYGSGVPTSTGLSSLWLVVFICCSFCCWFHCLYTAYRAGSNFRYGWFFFVTFVQLIYSGLMAAGIPYTGGAGYTLAIIMVSKGYTAASIVVFVSGIFWTIHFLWTFHEARIILKTYRAEGGSISKIQSDFKQESKKGLVSMATSEVGREVAVATVTSAASAQWGGEQPPP